MSKYRVTIPLEVSFDTYNTNRKDIEQIVYKQIQEFIEMVQQVINDELNWYHEQLDDYYANMVATNSDAVEIDHTATAIACPENASNIGLAGYAKQSTEVTIDNKTIRFEKVKND